MLAWTNYGIKNDDDDDDDDLQLLCNSQVQAS